MFWERCGKLIKFGWHLSAAVLVTAFVLAWTPYPSKAIGWLAMRSPAVEKIPHPGHIVVLGGGGIPSASGLMRTYSAAELYERFPDATWWVSLPADGDPETSSVGLMKQELVMRGIPADQVKLEHTALNTHQQSVELARLIGANALGEPVMLVTSDPHMRRAVAAFRKQGFTDLWPHNTRVQDVEADMGKLLKVRYSFWQNLENQVRFLRELVALAFYRLRGWA